MRRECRERFPPPPRFSDPDMHHGTCVTHVPWCKSGSLTNGFIWNRWRGKRSRHPRCMRYPRFCVSGKRPMFMCEINALQTFFKDNASENAACKDIDNIFQASVHECFSSYQNVIVHTHLNLFYLWFQRAWSMTHGPAPLSTRAGTPQCQ